MAPGMAPNFSSTHSLRATSPVQLVVQQRQKRGSVAVLVRRPAYHSLALRLAAVGQTDGGTFRTAS